MTNKQNLLPRITICIPVYNRVEHIEEAVDSALSQSYNNFDVVIVDNASTDGTWEILQTKYSSLENVSIYQNENNIGPVKNWLRSIQLASGDFIKILFSDDAMAGNFLTECYQKFTDEVSFVVTPAYIGKTIDQAQKCYLHDNDVLSNDYFRRYLVAEPSSLVSPGAALFRKRDLIAGFVQYLPGFEEDIFSYLGAGPDLLLFLRTMEKYHHVAYTNRTDVFFRVHDGSATTSTIKTGTRPIRISYNKSRAWHLSSINDERANNSLAGRILFTSLVENKTLLTSKDIHYHYYNLKHNYIVAVILALSFFYKFICHQIGIVRATRSL